MKYRTLLAISIVAGVLIAALPLYAPLLRQALGIPAAAGGGREWRGGRGGEAGAGSLAGEECQYLIKGVVEKADPYSGVIVVAGKQIAVKGLWSAPSGTVRWADLVAALQGRSVEVCARDSGLGLMAEKIYVSGIGLFERG